MNESLFRCPHCRSKETIVHSSRKHSLKRIYCKQCSNWSTKIDAPRVLLFDIETSQMTFSGWRTGKQYVGRRSIKQENFVISWSAKWLFNPDTISDAVTTREALKRDERRVIKSIHKLLDKADFVITHNGNRFDIRELNWHFLLHDLPPNNRYKSIDTLRKSREVFNAPSYAMDYLCARLGYDGKHHTDIDLWNGVEAGDQESIDKMSAYNINDVFMLEDLYLRIRPWMKTHPNFAIFADMYQELEADENMCPRCLQVINDVKYTKKYTTPAGYIYKSCSCSHCGCILRKTERRMTNTRIMTK